MTTSTPDEHLEIRRAIRELCDRFPGEYWRSLEPDRYPEEFVHALTEHGWLAALIPDEYGGAGLGVTAASVILEEINASGGNARWARSSCTEARSRSGATCRGSRPASSACRRSP